MSKIFRILLSLSFFLMVMSLQAETNNLLVASNAYMPEVPPVSRTAAIYVSLENNSKKTITLSAVSTSIARHSMFHQTVENDGVMKMTHESDIQIKAGETIAFSPGGRHIMLMGLTANPMPDKFILELELNSNVVQKIDVIVKRKSKQ